MLHSFHLHVGDTFSCLLVVLSAIRNFVRGYPLGVLFISTQRHIHNCIPAARITHAWALYYDSYAFECMTQRAPFLMLPADVLSHILHHIIMICVACAFQGWLTSSHAAVLSVPWSLRCKAQEASQIQSHFAYIWGWGGTCHSVFCCLRTLHKACPSLKCVQIDGCMMNSGSVTRPTAVIICRNVRRNVLYDEWCKICSLQNQNVLGSCIVAFGLSRLVIMLRMRREDIRLFSHHPCNTRWNWDFGCIMCYSLFKCAALA